MELTGELRREFFGGDVWVLRTDDGQSYQLNGEIPETLLDRRVQVEASRAEAAFGFAMVGAILDVRRISPV